MPRGCSQLETVTTYDHDAIPSLSRSEPHLAALRHAKPCCVQKLVGLNFEQEAREADLRYGLVRVRENAESIAFYNGASSEVGLLAGRLGKVVANYRGLVAASRNLDFFQSAYRYIIILLPAAVVAPLYFKVRRCSPKSPRPRVGRMFTVLYGYVGCIPRQRVV